MILKQPRTACCGYQAAAAAFQFLFTSLLTLGRNRNCLPRTRGGKPFVLKTAPVHIPMRCGSPSMDCVGGWASVIGRWSSYFLLLHVHPHLFEISLPTPAWLAGMSLRSCRPRWRELTSSSTHPDLLPIARKRGQHLGIYQKTRMCLFICLFILHLKSSYCSNWIRGKDLSPKEPWPQPHSAGMEVTRQ